MKNLDQENKRQTGEQMYKLAKTLFPIARSITGAGARKTLQLIKRKIPIKISEVPTGTKVFDWNIPKEWNIWDAYIKNSKGQKILDFKKSNLHILNYSIPVNRKIGLTELKKHLHTLPDHPDWIPYLTSYYKEDWGFCLSHNQYKKLKNEIYQVFIDSELENGNLTYGELYLRGKSRDEVLISTYICHPSLANDNLSGIILTAFLAARLSRQARTYYSYRFLFIPETIGAIAWLSLNEEKSKNIKHGLTVTCVGDSGQPTYKKSRQGDAPIDKAVEKVLAESGQPYKIISFSPADGSDERQFSSPGFNFAVGSLMRTPYSRYAEYHTSADNLSFIGPAYLADSLDKYLKTIFILENNMKYANLNPKGEPQLGRRGLYRILGSQKKITLNEEAIFWVLNFSDSKNDLLDISLRSGLKFEDVKNAAYALLEKDLLAKI
jgi:aminopeptidase-like protein